MATEGLFKFLRWGIPLAAGGTAGVVAAQAGVEVTPMLVAVSGAVALGWALMTTLEGAMVMAGWLPLAP